MDRVLQIGKETTKYPQMTVPIPLPFMKVGMNLQECELNSQVANGSIANKGKTTGGCFRGMDITVGT